MDGDAWATIMATLPAVDHVLDGRIFYRHEFKVAMVAAWQAGTGVITSFRQAGLTTAMVGRKRIERCAERWRKDPSLREEARTVPDPKDLSRWTPSPEATLAVIALQALRIADLEERVRNLSRRAVEPETAS